MVFAVTRIVWAPLRGDWSALSALSCAIAPTTGPPRSRGGGHGSVAFAVALALLAFAGLAPGAAQAAPTWVAPVDFTGTAAEGPEVGVDAQGNAVAVWSFPTGTIISFASQSLMSPASFSKNAGRPMEPRISIFQGRTIAANPARSLSWSKC